MGNSNSSFSLKLKVRTLESVGAEGSVIVFVKAIFPPEIYDSDPSSF